MIEFVSLLHDTRAYLSHYMIPLDLLLHIACYAYCITIALIASLRESHNLCFITVCLIKQPESL